MADKNTSVDDDLKKLETRIQSFANETNKRFSKIEERQKCFELKMVEFSESWKRIEYMLLQGSFNENQDCITQVATVFNESIEEIGPSLVRANTTEPIGSYGPLCPNFNDEAPQEIQGKSNEGIETKEVQMFDEIPERDENAVSNDKPSPAVGELLPALPSIFPFPNAVLTMVSEVLINRGGYNMVIPRSLKTMPKPLSTVILMNNSPNQSLSLIGKSYPHSHDKYDKFALPNKWFDTGQGLENDSNCGIGMVVESNGTFEDLSIYVGNLINGTSVFSMNFEIESEFCGNTKQTLGDFEKVLNVERNVKFWDPRSSLTLLVDDFEEIEVVAFMFSDLEKEFKVQENLWLGYNRKVQLATGEAGKELLEMHDSSIFQDNNQLAKFSMATRFIIVKCSTLMSRCSDDAQKLTAIVFSSNFKLQSDVKFIDEVDGCLRQHLETKNEHLSNTRTELKTSWDGSTDKNATVIALISINLLTNFEEAIIGCLLQTFKMRKPCLTGRTKVLQVVLKAKGSEDNIECYWFAGLFEKYISSHTLETCKRIGFVSLKEFMQNEKKIMHSNEQRIGFLFPLCEEKEREFLIGKSLVNYGKQRSNLNLDGVLELMTNGAFGRMLIPTVVFKYLYFKQVDANFVYKKGKVHRVLTIHMKILRSLFKRPGAMKRYGKGQEVLITGGFKEQVKMVDVKSSETISFDEPKRDLRRVCYELKKLEIQNFVEVAYIENWKIIGYILFLAATMSLKKLTIEENKFFAFNKNYGKYISNISTKVCFIAIVNGLGSDGWLLYGQTTEHLWNTHGFFNVLEASAFIDRSWEYFLHFESIKAKYITVHVETFLVLLSVHLEIKDTLSLILQSSTYSFDIVIRQYIFVTIHEMQYFAISSSPSSNKLALEDVTADDKAGYYSLFPFDPGDCWCCVHDCKAASLSLIVVSRLSFNSTLRTRLILRRVECNEGEFELFAIGPG